jgi:PAS domain-containing protein
MNKYIAEFIGTFFLVLTIGYRVVRPDGEVRWIAGLGRVEFDHDGKPICMRGVARDVTLRKQAEEGLRDQRMTGTTVSGLCR